MLHILLAIVLIAIGIGLLAATVARSSVASRLGPGTVSTMVSENVWILPVAGVVLIVVGILSAARVF